MRIAEAVVLAVVTTVTACGGKTDDSPPKRTADQQRKADSTIGASRLPGAGAVTKALAASDSAKAHQRMIDSIANSP